MRPLEDVAKEILLNPLALPEPEEALELLERARTLFKEESVVLELSKPALVVGDTHGDLKSSMLAWRALREREIIVFLGDLVDRGPYQVENLLAVLSMKLLYPDRVYILRGNHETPSMNMYYGFAAASHRYGPVFLEGAHRVFGELPLAAVLDGYVLLHGGVPEGLWNVRELSKRGKGGIEPRDPVIIQLLWNDPREHLDWFAESPRGPGIKLFGRMALSKFLEDSEADALVRAHEFYPEGVKEMFSGRLISLFSCRYYGGVPGGLRIREEGREGVSLE
ncbi:MAG: hypothetical protein DRO06_02225 [Thermoproteota archaeon]|nr:MAG: hypothetical protein DRO06_02225 [Candidatus Korarchaeota archaeon]